MELRNEEIKYYSTVSSGVFSYAVVKELATALLAEMDKHSVWTDAPEWADVAQITWRDKENTKHKSLMQPYARELPMSREREIAEEHFDKESYIGMCELAILKAKAEWEAGR